MEQLTQSEIRDIRGLQQLAYECAETVAAGLEEGVTEREAARRLGVELRARGAQAFFHTPFAWFGDRAGFAGFARPGIWRPIENIAFARRFFPTERRLARGMAAILDCAPIRDGLCADIGYAFSLGEHAESARARELLLELRGRILDGVRGGKTMREVYVDVDERIARGGYESAHALYPSGVLGHRVGRVPFARLPASEIAGFDARTYLYFGSLLLEGVRRVPLWNGTRLADVPPASGLWAVEPHIRCDRGGGFGAKWEEILVVDETGARWLDDDLPHVRVGSGRNAA